MASKAVTRACLLACSLGWLSACQDTGPHGSHDIYGNGEPGTGGLACESNFASDECDIADKDCQQQILEITACVRGDDLPKLPPMRVISKEQFRSELADEADKMGIVETPWDTAFRLLALEPEGSNVDTTVDATVQSVAAYYSDETKDVTIIDDPDADPMQNMFVLSHELTHFLQDRNMDLGAGRKAFVHDSDSGVSFKALVEGEAVVSSNRVQALWKGLNVDRLNWTPYFDHMDDAIEQQVLASGSPLFSALQGLPYPVGGRYLAQVWADYDHDHIADLYAGPPEHLIDWLGSYGDGEPAKSLHGALDCEPPLPADGTVVYGLDHLGATGVYALLAALGKLDEDRDLVTGLRADTIVVYAPSAADDAPASPASVAWRLRFGSTTQADALFQALQNNPSLIVSHAGEELLITAHDDQAPAFSDAALQSCPKQAELVAAAASARSMHALPHLDSLWR
ncbi:MAG TPA: hypothetical protein VHM19_03485 [Polyangiales bacterium]|jgi:hypothetical protein|nr:hypothetical protein [Polyangiales bacterium]